MVSIQQPNSKKTAPTTIPIITPINKQINKQINIEISKQTNKQIKILDENTYTEIIGVTIMFLSTFYRWYSYKQRNTISRK